MEKGTEPDPSGEAGAYCVENSGALIITTSSRIPGRDVTSAQGLSEHRSIAAGGLQGLHLCHGVETWLFKGKAEKSELGGGLLRSSHTKA